MSLASPTTQSVRSHGQCLPHPLLELAWRAELPRLKRKARLQYLAITKKARSYKRRFQDDRKLIKLLESLHGDTANRLRELVQTAIKRMQECRSNNPCELPGCPKCAGELTKQYVEGVINTGIRFIQADPKRHSIIAITVTPVGSRWNGSASAIHRTIESEVLERLIPFCNSNASIKGGTLHFDLAPSQDIPAVTHSPETLLLIHQAEHFGHLHGQLALVDIDVSESNLAKTAERWTRTINRKYAGYELEFHLKPLSSDDGNFATDFRKLAGCASYAAKARPRIRDATVTRVLRGEFIGAKLHWSTGIYATAVNPTAIAKDEIRRIERLQAGVKELVEHLETQSSTLRSPRLGRLFSRSIILSINLVEVLEELRTAIVERWKRDKRLVNDHGRDALKFIWSDELHEDRLPPYAVYYLHHVQLLNSRIARTQRRLDEQMPRLLRVWVRLLRCGVLDALDDAPANLASETSSAEERANSTAPASAGQTPRAAIGSVALQPTTTAPGRRACRRLVDHISLASATYEARTNLRRLHLQVQQTAPCSSPLQGDQASISRELCDAVDGLQSQNNVFPGWLYSETPADLQQRQWWSYCARMLLT